MENRRDHVHGNHDVLRIDRTPIRPWVGPECFNIQVRTPFDPHLLPAELLGSDFDRLVLGVLIGSLRCVYS